LYRICPLSIGYNNSIAPTYSRQLLFYLVCYIEAKDR